MSSTESIGERIREIRKIRGMSLRKAAQELAVSPSLLSQVETGKSLPSVSTLYALAAVLGVSADELLGMAARDRSYDAEQRSASASPDVQRAADNAVIEMEDGVQWERLAVSATGRVDSLLVTYQPGATSSAAGKLLRHSGFEHALILEGELTLQLEFERYVLGSGDSLQFESARPHLYSNLGPGIARGVWFVLDPREPSFDAGAGHDELRQGRPLRSRSAAVDALRRSDQHE